MKLNVNGKEYDVKVPAEKPLLWVLREDLKLTGTKYGCGKGLCGSCTCHLNGSAVRTCVLPVSAANGGKVTTIEGLGEAVDFPIQKAWTLEEVPQCGYCQSGQIMQAAALIKSDPNPSDAAIDGSMTNICRCGTYQRIRKAIKRTVAMRKQSASQE